MQGSAVIDCFGVKHQWKSNLAKIWDYIYLLWFGIKYYLFSTNAKFSDPLIYQKTIFLTTWYTQFEKHRQTLKTKRGLDGNDLVRLNLFLWWGNYTLSNHFLSTRINVIFHKTWSISLIISFLNVDKSAEDCRFFDIN